MAEFFETYPWFRSTAESGDLAGGITVDGFTVNIHLLMGKMLDHVEAIGGQLAWNCQVQAMQRNAHGEVTALQSQHGLLQADHYVVSTDTTSHALLTSTACENLIHRVLGPSCKSRTWTSKCGT